MLKTNTKLTAITTLAVATLFGAHVNSAAAIGVVGHGTYFGRYNNPLQSSVYLASAPAYAAPAPVYAAPVYAPQAPVYQAPAPVYAAPTNYCAPVCNPCPSPCDPCAQSCYRPVAPAPVVAVPVSPRYPTITGGYSPAVNTAYRVPVAVPARPFWP